MLFITLKAKTQESSITTTNKKRRIMKKTYTGTIFNPNLSEAEIKVVRYNKCKYIKDSEPVERSYFTKVTSWDVISGGEEAKEVEDNIKTVDENHEYLILHFETGETTTFMNSHVDMFIM